MLWLIYAPFCQSKKIIVFGDKVFTSLPLIEYLKSDVIWYTGTIRAPRLKNCPVLAEKDRKERGVVLTSARKKMGK